MKSACVLLLLVYVLSFNGMRCNTPMASIISFDEYNQTATKENAFQVLRAKCNICHATKKRTDIFTLENMDSLAADINKQVFVKKKMPKGRKIKLTDDERNQLKVWLGEILIEK